MEKETISSDETVELEIETISLAQTVQEKVESVEELERSDSAFVFQANKADRGNETFEKVDIFEPEKETKSLLEAAQQPTEIEAVKNSDLTFVVESQLTEKVEEEEEEEAKVTELAEKKETIELDSKTFSPVETFQETVAQFEKLKKSDSTFVVPCDEADKVNETSEKVDRLEIVNQIISSFEAAHQSVSEETEETASVDDLEKHDYTFVIQPEQAKKNEIVELENAVNDSTEAIHEAQDSEFEVDESKVKCEELLVVNEDARKEKESDQREESFAFEGACKVKLSDPHLVANQDFEPSFEHIEAHEDKEMPQVIIKEKHFDEIGERKDIEEAKEDQKLELELNESEILDKSDERPKSEAINFKTDVTEPLKDTSTTSVICENSSLSTEFESFSDSLELLEMTNDNLTFSSTVQTPDVSSIKLSESAEKVLKESDIAKSCIVIQKHVRGYLARKNFKTAINAAILIQKTWRGYKTRKHLLQDDCFEQIFQKVKLSNDNATAEMTLGKRTSSAFHRLIHYKHFTQLTCEVKSLELTTRLSPESCLTIASENTIKTLEDIINKSNRSEPNKLIIYYSFGILINLVKVSAFNHKRTHLITLQI